MKIMLVCLSFMLLAASAASAATPMAEGVKPLKCTFDKDGIITHWNDDGSIKVEKGMYASKPQGTILIFDQIDKNKRIARATANGNTVDVALINSQGLLSFFQISPNGNQILVSVYVGSPLADKSFPAVISRHLSEKTPLVSQYYGSCVEQRGG